MGNRRNLGRDLLAIAAIAIVFVVGRRGLTPSRRPALTALLVAILGQMAVGYTQYFTGEPIALVVIHVMGATATWAIVLFLPPSLRSRGAAPA